MFSWGLVTAAHALIHDKSGYLTGEFYALRCHCWYYSYSYVFSSML